jgi:hypothetical protein
MRVQRLVLIGVAALPGVLSAQVGRIPLRPSQRTPAEPASPPPEIPVVSKELSYRRARWSFESYTMFSTIQVANPNGGTSSFTSIGAGTHGDYHISEHWSASMDMTASALGSPSINETAEVGTRFTPGVWSADYRGIRPFFDVRAAYMHMYDTFTSPVGVVTGSTRQFADGQRYSRGFGAVAGAGADFPLTNSLALTGEITGMRNHMRTYRLTMPAALPSGTSYSMTTYRVALGFKYNPVSALHLSQNPTK